jgi:hypothetical protein
MHGRMTGGRARGVAAACALLLGACGGDASDAGAEKDAAPPPVTVQALEGVQVELHLPDSLAFGQTGEVRATVANRSGASLAGARLQLFLQSPLQPAPDSAAPLAAGAPAVTPVPAESGVRLTFAVGALAAGQAGEVVQRVRLPLATARDTGAVAIRVRAWVETVDSRIVGRVAEDTLLPRAPSAAACGGAGSHVTRYGIGGVRLGMKANELRGMCPGVRDTAWRAEGMAEKGLVFPLAGHALLAVLNGDSVARVVVRDGGLTTPVGVGVGSTLGDLRTRYGRTCAGAAEGAPAVWFPVAPGISFGLAAPAPPDWRNDPSALPDTATVARLWVRKGTDDCPAPPPAAPSPPQEDR